MVDIRPPVFPIGLLPRVAFKSPPLRAVLNLLSRAPIQVRVMQEWRVFSVYQKNRIALPDTGLATKIHPFKFTPMHRNLS
jgi:hypothetical protein